MSFRRLFSILVLALFCSAAASAAVRPKDFDEICKTLTKELQERTSTHWNQNIQVTRVARISSSSYDLYFNAELSYYPWRKGDVEWFRKRLVEEAKELLGGSSIRKIISNRYELPDLVLPEINNDGTPVPYSRKIEDPREENGAFVRRVDAPVWSSGLSGRNIALWQSHGRYFDRGMGVWAWQRATMHRTVEDMYTQSYVLPFLMPMLENAGAYILSPRERDINPREIICDNDPAFTGEREALLRREGAYSESGSWDSVEAGFADFKREYTFEDNPFYAGTARISLCSGSEKSSSRARWIPEIEERGEYAVYVSYKSFENSCEEARYTIHHLGGETEFSVNQKRGGSTWIYLGTFEFGEGKLGYIDLDNRGKKGDIVCADGVKIGGGMGKILRGGSLSGVPSAYEGAHYWMQWAGVDTEITQNWDDDDYTNDFATRGLWTVMMRAKKDIPIDLSLAFHSDAGVAKPDTTIGTLAIYTRRNEGEREMADGRDRVISRLLCDFVQTSIVEDVRADFNPDWSRRGIWDRSYSESRTTGVPAMILELLSHQNFADMKYGLDPAFRFTVSRAVYKGILKTLSSYYGCDYMVQPLPVSSFASELSPDGNFVQLSWKPTEDRKEPTAVSEGYILYTRMDDGTFDQGQYLSEPYATIEIESGHIYSFKVEAYNRGGKSFPSEILSVGVPDDERVLKPILVVNNFNKVSGPAWVDKGGYAGFDGSIDGGVAYLRDISYVGEVYEFDRSAEYVDNFYSGHGASFDDRAGLVVAGNSFDYPYVHGEILMNLGYPFFSMSRDAFIHSCDTLSFALDLICGKQSKTQPRNPDEEPAFEVFPEAMQEALTAYAARGSHIFLSGSRIASDCESFPAKLFGYKLATPRGTSLDYVMNGEHRMSYYKKLNSESYCIENCDGIKKASSRANIWLRFPGGSAYGAGINYINGNSKTVSLTIPLESFKSKEDRRSILSATLRYFEAESSQMILGN